MYQSKAFSLALALVATIALLILPSSHSEAQSVDVPLSELSCSKLNNLRFDQMNAKQTAYAAQCDANEAEQAWQKEYGQADQNTAAIVYDPS